MENQEYLQNQLITYIGNKRALLDFIGKAIEIVLKELGKDKIDCLDMFSGSGVVARYLKQFSSSLTVNDLEQYSSIINTCYLANLSDQEKLELQKLHKELSEKIDAAMNGLEKSNALGNSFGENSAPGFISELYSPKNITNIQSTDRCFYTTYNANYIDISRQLINTEIPEKYRPFFIAPLLSEASIHANTSGVFKGFYKNSQTGIGQFGGNGKNAISRIMGKIQIPFPVFSSNQCPFRVFNEDANSLVLRPELYDIPQSQNHIFDLAYFDPPYNQHPYGSNYFMLNLIAKYERPEVSLSRVSGIPTDWNRSNYNKQKKVQEIFFELIKNVRAKYVLISFNSEGFISKDEMMDFLSSCGKVQILEENYNTFRGSRNLKKRNIYVKEYLFLLKKDF